MTGGDAVSDAPALHHRYFECNYGGSVAPLDKLFGTFHDGSPAAHEAMRERLRARHGAVA